MTGSLPWLDAEQVTRLLPVAEAIDALEAGLHGDVDPGRDPSRSAIPTSAGQLLLMPSEVDDNVGVKVATVAPGNPALGLPRIQAVYVLFDRRTLTPLALLDGTALTALRTPAVSALAVRHLAEPDAARLVLFGTGPQAWGHVTALRAVRQLTSVVVVGRDPARADAFVERVRASGLAARAGGAEAVATADLVVCATTAADPLFDGAAVPESACVVAIGSHEPDRRELDATLLGRASVVVEDRATALREAGDVILAVAEGAVQPADLHTLADLVTRRAAIEQGRPTVFKGVGMAWQDLVVGAELHRRLHRP